MTSYKADGALDQLIAIDAAYLGVIAVANFFFPYVLPCTFFNPVQLLSRRTTGGIPDRRDRERRGGEWLKKL